MVTRYPDWQARLGAFLAANASRAFRYGEWDCCLFVADAVKEMTGVDLAIEFRGRYGSRAQALQVMTSTVGAPSVERTAAFVAQEHRLDRVAPAMAARGDMVLIRRRREYSLGLVNLSGQDLVMPFARGLMRVDRKHAAAAWRI